MAIETLRVEDVTLKANSTDSNSEKKTTNILYANHNYTNENVKTAYRNFVNNIFGLSTNSLIDFQVVVTNSLTQEE